MNIVIDIETIPGHADWIKADIAGTIQPPGNIKKPESIAKWHEEKSAAVIDDKYARCGLDAATGEIICIGCKVGDSKYITVFDHKTGNEHDILIAFFLLLEDIYTKSKRPPFFIGHNIIAFDLPYIYRRCMVNGISPAPHIKQPADLKAWDTSVFDTMIAWSGVRDRISLDKLCKVFGIAGKGDVSGADVYPMYLDGKLDEISEYCKHDVEITSQLYAKLKAV